MRLSGALTVEAVAEVEATKAPFAFLIYLRYGVKDGRFGDGHIADLVHNRARFGEVDHILGFALQSSQPRYEVPFVCLNREQLQVLHGSMRPTLLTVATPPLAIDVCLPGENWTLGTSPPP